MELQDLTVTELIALLQALPEEQKQYRVGCLYDCDCTSTGISSIVPGFTKWDDGNLYILFQGE